MAHLKRIYEHKKEDAIAQVKSVIGGHLIFGVLALAGNNFQLENSPHAMFCLGLFVVLSVTNWTYSWKDPIFNWLSVIAYLVFTIIEFVTYGLPASMLGFSEGYNKGAFLEGIMHMVPFVYALLRFLLVIPLVIVSWLSLKNSNPVSRDQ
jgi:hypothetical protein